MNCIAPVGYSDFNIALSCDIINTEYSFLISFRSQEIKDLNTSMVLDNGHGDQ